MNRSAFAFAPGQYFLEAADPIWGHQFVEVARIDRDQNGTPRVTFRYAGGREVSIYTGQARAALAAGLLVPAEAAEQRAA